MMPVGIIGIIGLSSRPLRRHSPVNQEIHALNCYLNSREMFTKGKRIPFANLYRSSIKPKISQPERWRCVLGFFGF
jgi:hypothetical protein